MSPPRFNKREALRDQRLDLLLLQQAKERSRSSLNQSGRRRISV